MCECSHLCFKFLIGTKILLYFPIVYLTIRSRSHWLSYDAVPVICQRMSATFTGFLPSLVLLSHSKQSMSDKNRNKGARNIFPTIKYMWTAEALVMCKFDRAMSQQSAGIKAIHNEQKRYFLVSDLLSDKNRNKSGRNIFFPIT